jgi:hypothetical protein
LELSFDDSEPFSAVPPFYKKTLEPHHNTSLHNTWRRGWISTIVEIANIRITMGEPWGKMAMILGAVALFTAVSGLILNVKKVKEKYPRKYLQES